MILHIPAIREQDHYLRWTGLAGCARALAISELSAQEHRPLLVMTDTPHDAERLQHEIGFFSGTASPIVVFPDLETLPYDHFTPHPNIISERLGLLAGLESMERGIIIAHTATLMYRLLSKASLLQNSVFLTPGDSYDILSLKQACAALGYRAVNQVMEHGQYRVQGTLCDVFPMGSRTPCRIEFLNHAIQSIRTFDSENQRSLKKIENITLLPAHVNHTQEDTSSFFDYLPSNTICLFEDHASVLTHFWREINNRYALLKHDHEHPVSAPSALFLAVNEFNHALKQFTQIHMTQIHMNAPRTKSQFNIRSDIPIASLSQLENYLIHYRNEHPKGRILFCSESAGRREILMDLLKTTLTSSLLSDMPLTLHATWEDFLASNSIIGVTISSLENGMVLHDIGIVVITETELFGEHVKPHYHRKNNQIDPQVMIRHLTELHLGDPIVHFNHGVGRYRGLQMITAADTEAEYLVLEYANQDKIYVPVSSLHLISRYTGADSAHAPLQKLGTQQWEKIKKKAAEKIHDVAAELLHIYSQRAASTGYAFVLDKTEYHRFVAHFKFQETPDQRSAIDAVIQDMTSARCMDRLICGDVGFGKTEVAMRATFIAASNHKQVAILVPTTLLATQHLQNFRDRFAEWPFKIAGLSRMVTPQEQKKILAGLAAGTIDIVIGTHKLLSKTIQFKDLGLLVIDEEQRFGVQQKEHITALRLHMDILTLTATPIPRTLNMALVGTRDLSMITTPPQRRLSVKTWVHEYDDDLIREAILREMMRGGQVYFLHNEVATINQQAVILQKIVPEARIAVAHGQLHERELERVMADFYHQRVHVLVCSTIIESGIDVPSANTMIIHRADHLGLAQLHQLRGRIGRAHHQAYAYLLTPPRINLSEDAIKRLDAIAELSELGSGFHLATHDLEIRGAGVLLGEEQSGHMLEIGFTLYMELLEQAVAALKAGHTPTCELKMLSTAEIDLDVPALLPSDYIGDVGLRLTFYKRLAYCKNTDEIQDLKAEWIDRFGPLPLSAEHLLTAAHLKLQANMLGILKIEIRSEFGYIYFSDQPHINSTTLIKLIQTQPSTYQLQGPQKIRFKIQPAPPTVEQLTLLLKRLTP